VALFLIPDVLLRIYGEDRPARQALEEMKKYRAWYDRHAEPNGILVEGCPNPTGQPCPNGLGDWSNPPGTVKDVTLDKHGVVLPHAPAPGARRHARFCWFVWGQPTTRR
jgi:hypothetical protein